MKELLLAAIFLLQVQAPGQNEGGMVTGKLRLANGTPAVGTRVAAIPVPKEEDNVAEATLMGLSRTDATGTYRIEGIPPGRYYIFAGLLDFPNYYPGARVPGDAKVLVVEAGSALSGIDFSVLATSGGQVAGRLSEPTSATVTLSPRFRGGREIQRETNDKGDFLFVQVPAGNYSLTSSVSSAMLSIVVSGDVDNLVLPVVLCTEGVEIRGRLLSVPTTPVNRIDLRGKKIGCIPQARINADGSFVIRGVARDDVYTVSLTPSPHGFNGLKVTVEDQDLTLEIPLRNLDVRGRVTFENGVRPPADYSLRVYAQRIRTNEVLAHTPAKDGTFWFQLTEGSHDFSASVPLNYVVKSMSYGNVDLFRDPLTVGGAFAEEVRLVVGFDEAFEPGFRVSGRVIPPAGGGAKPSRVHLVSSQGDGSVLSIEALLAEDGSFVFRGLDPGRSNVKAAPDSPAALREIVVEQADVTGLEITLP